MNADNNLLAFKVSAPQVTYGDNRKFPEYRIYMFAAGKPVGIEEGPRRTYLTRYDAVKAANQRIKELLAHRLYIVRVTNKHIADGEGRNCHTCAISQALWHNQERMGLPRRNYNFEVAPYGAFIEPRGIVLSTSFSDEPDIAIANDSLPDLVVCSRSGKIYSQDLPGWAMAFDDWYDSKYISLKEWRERHGYEDDERPSRPGPTSFVLDLDAFKPVVEAA